MIGSTDLVAEAYPAIGRLGSLFYFTPETVARGKGRCLSLMVCVAGGLGCRASRQRSRSTSV